MINRLIKQPKNNSFFIFGARGTGKSTWLEKEFLPSKDSLTIDLLNPNTEELFSKHPEELLHQISSHKEPNQLWVAIDEIQKIPKLLDVVQMAIEKYRTKFVLTGSSARKLKRGHANLLGGRAFMSALFPFTHLELGEKFDLIPVLTWGSLPMMHTLSEDADRLRYLRAYTQIYLKEEILVEQIIRKLDPFRLFLEIAAQQSGEIINYTRIANEVNVDVMTVQSYFQILEDTLLGFTLLPYHQSLRKRQRTNPKFYYFDLGIKRSLEGSISFPLQPGTSAFGKIFEHFLILEIFRLNTYFEKDYRMSYLRTKDDAEIDLILERPGLPLALIEIKSSDHVGEKDIQTLRAFKKDLGAKAEYYCLSRDPAPKNIEGISLLPWEKGIQEIGLIGSK